MPLMYYPKFPGRRPTPTSLQAFNMVWEKKGWKLLTDYEGPVSNPAAYYADFNLTELRDEAKALDIPGRSSMNRDELIEAIVEAVTNE